MCILYYIYVNPDKSQWLLTIAQILHVFGMLLGFRIFIRLQTLQKFKVGLQLGHQLLQVSLTHVRGKLGILGLLLCAGCGFHLGDVWPGCMLVVTWSWRRQMPLKRKGKSHHKYVAPFLGLKAPTERTSPGGTWPLTAWRRSGSKKPCLNCCSKDASASLNSLAGNPRLKTDRKCRKAAVAWWRVTASLYTSDLRSWLGVLSQSPMTRSTKSPTWNASIGKY